MKTKIWMVKCIESDITSYFSFDPTRSNPNCILLAAPIEVEFDLYSEQEAAKREIEALEKTVETMRAEHTLALNVVLGRIQELRAIPDMRESEE